MASWQYMYCILEGGDLPAGSHRGLEGAPVRGVAHKGISAVVSELPRPRVPASMRNVLCHERLVEELMGERTLLPVRFGTVLGGATDVKLALAEGYRSFLKDLDLVRGKVEFGVKVLAPLLDPEPREGSEASWPSGPGTRYLAERLRLDRRGRVALARFRNWARAIDAGLMRCAEDRRASWVQPSQKMVMSASYLVWQHGECSFKEEVEAQREAFPELHFLLTGPWPAYSFVTPIEGEGGALGA